MTRCQDCIYWNEHAIDYAKGQVYQVRWGGCPEITVHIDVDVEIDGHQPDFINDLQVSVETPGHFECLFGEERED